MLENVPAGHALHCAAPGPLNVPALQTLQRVAPDPLDVPAGQVEQEPGLRLMSTQVPGGHLVQPVGALALYTVPGLQPADVTVSVASPVSW